MTCRLVPLSVSAPCWYYCKHVCSYGRIFTCTQPRLSLSPPSILRTKGQWGEKKKPNKLLKFSSASDTHTPHPRICTTHVTTRRRHLETETGESVSSVADGVVLSTSARFRARLIDACWKRETEGSRERRRRRRTTTRTGGEEGSVRALITAGCFWEMSGGSQNSWRQISFPLPATQSSGVPTFKRTLENV